MDRPCGTGASTIFSSAYLTPTAGIATMKGAAIGRKALIGAKIGNFRCLVELETKRAL